MKQETATALASMMSQVVREGTGTAAALSGIDVAGKTGTAEVGGTNQAWFIGFAPVEQPAGRDRCDGRAHARTGRDRCGADREAGDGGAC